MKVLFGILFILFGVIIILNPSFYDPVYDYKFDFTDIKWPLGILFILLGLAWTILTFKKKR